ncbi:16S rRNA (cytidine(1402)-2'-O)-methyltransferase [Rhizobium setariae]|uniref:16S rRNA (cytidine(1402)-2'-O)-methyltransferase n=1 Tax=Rhizobium setariae TaxID=2801340 RepID=UPI001FEF32AA|nr:16S rRNA (cytidine(1402)-2'-O)-methyltransferase [Rhizobium setariae]
MADDDIKDESQSGSFRIRTLTVPARPLETALYLVATPIGNLGDITLRALETLAGADMLAAEDTRVTRVLLDRYGINKRPYAYHEYNASEVGPKLIAAIESGKSVALVSDAGTPLVSDPGFRLVKEALAAGLKVVPVPGASSVITALSAAGLPNEAFFFAGFLPQKEKARRDRLAEIAVIPGTLLYFESPHRLGASLRDAADMLGGSRAATVCRELTKTFEEFRRGTLAELADYYAINDNVKGEIVVAVAPPEAVAAPEGQALDDILKALAVHLPTAKAATEAARQTGLPRKDLYQRLLELKE